MRPRGLKLFTLKGQVPRLFSRRRKFYAYRFNRKGIRAFFVRKSFRTAVEGDPSVEHLKELYSERFRSEGRADLIVAKPEGNGRWQLLGMVRVN